MPFKIRNTITIAAILLLMAGVSAYFLFFRYPGAVDKKKNQIKEYDKSIVLIPEREEYLNQVEKMIEEKRINLASLDKIVEADVSIANAFSYLDKIQDKFGSLNFDLKYVSTVQATGYGYKVFSLNGEGTFESIFSLIWVLERGPKIFSIEKLSLRGVESLEEETETTTIVIPFELQVRAKYVDKANIDVFNQAMNQGFKSKHPVRKEKHELQLVPSNVQPIDEVSVPYTSNVFSPLIASLLPPNADSLLEVERADLRAIISGKAVIADHEGNIHVLKEGDPVYLGYLTKIEYEKNLVEFTLNKGGIVEKFTLYMPFSAEKE